MCDTKVEGQNGNKDRMVIVGFILGLYVESRLSKVVK